MTMTRADVVAVLGAVDDALVAAIIATGATAEELVEAQAWIEADDTLMDEGRPLPAGGAGRLVEILSTIEEDDEPAPPA
ncbi:MAG: hypothetical protein AB7O45_13710 [Alphaproteobacteria bacterium]